MKALIVALALLLLIVHIWLSRQLHDGPNEKILTEAVQPGIQDDFGDNITIKYDYLDGVIEGVVSDEVARQKASARAKELRPAGRIINRIKIASKPATLFAGLADGKVTLRGMVPDQSTKNGLLSAASKLNRGEVIDQIQVSNTVASAPWLTSMPSFMDEFFEGANSGEIDIDQDDVRLRRGVRSSNSKKNLITTAEKWNKPMVDEITLIRDRPSRLKASLTKAGITLKGLVPDTKTKSALVSSAKALGQGEVTDELVVAEDVMDSKWGTDMPGFMTSFFADTNSAEIEASDKNIRLWRGLRKKNRKQALVDSASKWSLPVVDEMKIIRDRPASFLASLGKRTITLDGLVSSDETADKLHKAALSLGASNITNNLEVADDVIDSSWESDMPSFLPRFFKGAESGEIEANQKNVRLNRQVRGKQAKAALTESAAQWKLPVVDEISLIRDQPGNLMASLNDKIITLKGNVPSSEIKASLGREAQKSGFRVINEIEVKEDVKDLAWPGRLDGYMGPFFIGAESGEFEIQPGKVRINREFPDEANKIAWVKRSKAIAPDWDLMDQLTIRKVIPEPESVPMVPTKPASILALLNNRTLMLSGNVPNAAMKRSVMNAVTKSLPDVKITNSIKVDEEVKTPEWEEGVAGMMSNFFATESKQAEFEITPKKLRLKQELPDKSKKELLVTKAKGLVSGRNSFIDQLTVYTPPPPPVPKEIKPSKRPIVMAELSPEVITLDGMIPNEPARKAIIAGVRKAYPEAKLTDKMKVSKEVFPTPWADNFGNFLTGFPTHAKNGSVKIKGDTVEIAGLARNPILREQLVAKLSKALPKDIQIQDRLRVEKPKEPTQKVEKLPTFTVYYDTGAYWMTEPGYDTVWKAISAIKQLKGSQYTILVKGFADSQGDAELNKRLSEQRANGVVEVLSGPKQGAINRDQIRFVGVGESEASTDGANQNDRRVEITIVE